MHPATVGRRTGQTRDVIIGYFEDGPNLVMAMNGWGDCGPAWWLNLQAHPDVTVDLVDGARHVIGRAASRESANVCGGDGGRSTRTSTPMPHDAPWRRQSLSSSRGSNHRGITWSERRYAFRLSRRMVDRSSSFALAGPSWDAGAPMNPRQHILLAPPRRWPSFSCRHPWSAAIRYSLSSCGRSITHFRRSAGGWRRRSTT